MAAFAGVRVLSRRRASLVGAALVAASLVLMPSSAAALTARSVALTASPANQILGSVVRLSGVATSSPTGTAVLVETMSGSRWVRFATVKTTKPSGNYGLAYATKSLGTRYFRARVLATRTLGTAASPIRAVATYRKTTATLAVSRTAVAAGQSVTFSGAQSPFVTGATVFLQRKSGASWVTDGASTTIPSTGRFAFIRNPATGTTTWRTVVSKTSNYYATAVTPSVAVTAAALPGPTPTPEPTPTPTSTPEPTPTPTEPVDVRPTFGELMHPMATTVLPDSVASVTFSKSPPEWWSEGNTLIRWDTPDAFSHSLAPTPYGTLYSARVGADHTRPWAGAEYHVNTPSWKNADVSFKVTGKKFAIRYLTVKDSDAMVWIDGVPVASEPFAGSDPEGSGSWNWLVVARATGEEAEVRFAGPFVFTGVDFDPADAVAVTAADRFTLGVLSDSTFETLATVDPMTQSPGPMLSSLTGFRVWNMAEGGTGYVNDGTGFALSGGLGFGDYRTSPFGSDRRIAAIASAPIDALVVNGSINDLGWGAAAHRDAMDAFLARVAQVRPDLPVVLVSLQPLSYGTVRDQADPRFKALNANYAEVAAHHSNVVGVIDPYTGDWLTGTGSTANPAGDGNQDQYVGSDGVHFTAAGQGFYQGRIADALRPLKARLTP